MPDETPDTPELPDDLITPAEAAKITHASCCTVWRWIRHGRLRAWRVGTGRILVSARDVRALIQPIAVKPPLPKRDTSGERMTAELDRRREAQTRKLLKLPPLGDNGAA